MKGLKRLFGIATLVLLMVLTIAPINTFANQSIDDTGQNEGNRAGEEPELGRVIVIYESSKPDTELKKVVLEGEVGKPYSIEILDFDGYTYTGILPPSGGHAQLEGFFEKQEQHAYLKYESNIIEKIYVRISINDNFDHKGKRPDIYEYSVIQIDPSSAEETIVLSENMDISNKAKDYFYQPYSLQIPRFNNQGEKYEYRLESKSLSSYSSSYNVYFDYSTNNLITEYSEEDIADIATVTLQKKFGNPIEVRRRIADFELSEIEPVIPEYVLIHVKGNGEDIEGSPFRLDAQNNWYYSIDNLPNLDESGKEINYTVIEEAIEGFQSEVRLKNDYTHVAMNRRIRDFDIINTHVVDVTANKIWENSPSSKPDVLFQLFTQEEYYNDLGEIELIDVPFGEPVTLTNGNTSHTWKNLPKYLYSWNGVIEVSYSVKEVEVPEGYEVSYSDDKLTVTNRYTGQVIETVDVTGTKTWVDDNDSAGLRPTSITVNLLKNGTKIDSVVVKADDGWKYSFTGLPKQENGQDIVYTVSEETVDKYDTSYQGYDITNTYTPPVVPTVDVTGTKTWVDDNDAAGLRPTFITVNLLKNGTKIDSVEVNADDGWKYSFTGLPKQENGQDIVYTVSEETVDKYDTSYQGYDITNTYTPAAVPTVEVTGTKTWVDDNDAAGLRPTSITVNLLKNGTKIDSVEVNADNGWKYSFTGLPKQENDVDIVYTVSEETVAKYVTSYQGYDITNTYTPAAVPTVEVTGTKTWVDDNDAAGLRPTSITVNLLKNGTKIDSVEVNADTGWKYSFTNLPKQENDVDIVYTVSEETVAKYVTSYQGYNITNTYTPPVVPTDPEVPVDPTDPGKPVVPTDPEVPLEPTDPEVPVTPVEPIEPGKPSEPESPQLPSTGVSNIVLVISTVSMLSGLILLVSSNTRRKVTE